MGMWVATAANTVRPPPPSKDYERRMQAALRGGAVSGFFVVAMSLLGLRVFRHREGPCVDH